MKFRKILLVFLIILTSSLCYSNIQSKANSNIKEWKLFGVVNPFGIPTRGDEAKLFMDIAEVFKFSDSWAKLNKNDDEEWSIIYKNLITVLGSSLAPNQIHNWLKSYQYIIRKDAEIVIYKIHYIVEQIRIAVFCVIQKNQIHEIRIFVLHEDKNAEKLEYLLPHTPPLWTKSHVSLKIREVPHEFTKTLEQYQALKEQGIKTHILYNGIYLHLEIHSWR